MWPIASSFRRAAGAGALVVAGVAAPVAATGQTTGALTAPRYHRHPVVGGILLTAEQYAQIEAATAAYYRRLKVLYDSATAGGPVDQATNDRIDQQIYALRAASLRTVRAVLTADQQARFDENVAKLTAAVGHPPAPDGKQRR